MLQDASPSQSGGIRLIIVGAGASALTLASHLLRQDARAQVVLIEARAEVCAALRRGAYATILRAGLADAQAWLPPEAEAATHPLRLVRELVAHRDRLHVVQARCTGVAPTSQGIAVATEAGATWLGHAAAWAPPLSAVRWVPAGRRLRAVPASRARGRALRLDVTDIPLGTGIAYLTRWLRATVRAADRRGIPWTEVLDGLRLHGPEVWRHLTPRSRATFLRHGFAAWNQLTTGLPDEARRASAAGPERGGHVFALHPVDLMPYAAQTNLLDLDIACASLAGRVLRRSTGADHPGALRRGAQPRLRASS